MAEEFALDTNVYITALRDPHVLARLKRFRLRLGARLRVHAVVALELRAGARDDRKAAAVDAFIGTYHDRGRVIVPSFDAYLQAGRVLAALAVRERLTDAPRSLVNDALDAEACREQQTVLITDNTRDFAAIQRHLRGFKFRESSRVF